VLAPGGEGSGAQGGLAIVDLTARAYDGVEAIRVATASGARVVAVGQHDDVPLRKAALAAGAERVFTYRALFENGPSTLAAWLDR
jgi:DNA-binding NarL/FixJ family response regulator